jgi:hypothetical protein
MYYSKISMHQIRENTEEILKLPICGAIEDKFTFKNIAV